MPEFSPSRASHCVLMSWPFPESTDHTCTVNRQVNIPFGILEHLEGPSQLGTGDGLLETREGSLSPRNKSKIPYLAEAPGTTAQAKLG
eukprot:4782276-Pyramimonas_sp.AAC.1